MNVRKWDAAIGGYAGPSEYLGQICRSTSFDRPEVAMETDDYDDEMIEAEECILEDELPEALEEDDYIEELLDAPTVQPAHRSGKEKPSPRGLGLENQVLAELQYEVKVLKNQVRPRRRGAGFLKAVFKGFLIAAAGAIGKELGGWVAGVVGASVVGGLIVGFWGHHHQD